jgi:hypothetical protein
VLQRILGFGNIADYIRKRNPPNAKRVRASIYDSPHALSGAPEAHLRLFRSI